MTPAICPGCGLAVPAVRLFDGWRRVAQHTDPSYPVLTVCPSSHALAPRGGPATQWLPPIGPRKGVA